MYGRCSYLLKDRSKAEDAMQDVFAKALTHLADFRSEASPLTWLMKIATHHCLNMLRAERAPGTSASAGTSRRAAQAHGGPQLFEVREAVRKLLARCDLETQAAAVHYHVDEMTLDEVATLLGRSVPTIRKRLESFARISRRRTGAGRNDSTDRHRAGPAATMQGAGAAALLRRRARQAPSAPTIEAHTAACARCRARLKELGDEQRRFEQEHPVRSLRRRRRARRAHTTAVTVAAPARRSRWSCPTMGRGRRRWRWPPRSRRACAPATTPCPSEHRNRAKAAAASRCRSRPSASAGPQRTAARRHARAAVRRANGSASATSPARHRIVAGASRSTIRAR